MLQAEKAAFEEYEKKNEPEVQYEPFFQLQITVCASLLFLESFDHVVTNQFDHLVQRCKIG